MQSLKCPLCQSAEKQDSIGENTIICGVCYKSYKFRKPFELRDLKKPLFLFLVFILIGGGAFYYGLFDDEYSRFKKQVNVANDEEEIKSAYQYCPRGKEVNCKLLVYSRLNALRPEDISYKANLAMALTSNHDYKKASPIYEEIQKAGFSTYDLFASMGNNYEALGQNEEAVESYTNALAIVPNLIDVVQSLSGVLVKLNRSVEALSLLESFSAKYSGAEKYLQGQMISIRKLAGEPSSTDSNLSLRLMAIRGFHHYLPIQLGESIKEASFLVDTGASNLTMSTERLRKTSEEAFRKARQITLQLADGRKISGYLTTLPQIQIGPWKFQNVELTFCDTCHNLVGKSVLKNFIMKSIPMKGIEILDFTKI
jgi:predicted aspartyl protease